MFDVDASSSMRPDFLELRESKLWSAWAEFEDAVEFSGLDVETSFRFVLEED